MSEGWPSNNVLVHDPMRIYRAKRDAARKRVTDKYSILGFISSGTYGRVYKAQSKEEDSQIHAIKKFKPDKEGDVVTYTGISQSAIREIALNREISHDNVVALKEVILEDKSIYMVFEYAEHDFLQVINHHSQALYRTSIAQPVLKSLTFQLLNGLQYLHDAHIIHRDLKPANILVTSSGVVKIGDLGLARDKVVVTIWYRAPELLLGANHYNKAVDMWAVGCVVAELASLRPIFKGEEAKIDPKKNVPFQKDQLLKIFEVLGTPTERDWPMISVMPERENMRKLDRYTNRLAEWCHNRIPSHGADLLAHLFAYDPDKRLTAAEALQHRWFQEEPRPTRNAFESLPSHQMPPHRRVTQDDLSSMAAGSQIHAQVSQVQATAQAHPHSNHSKVGSASSFAGNSGGGSGGAHPRKKARMG
ncbi:kinase-like domain-containing protein [Trametes maxima]|nr:kinase-like domain-containing protein [Trametes maxima]